MDLDPPGLPGIGGRNSVWGQLANSDKWMTSTLNVERLDHNARRGLDGFTRPTIAVSQRFENQRSALVPAPFTIVSAAIARACESRAQAAGQTDGLLDMTLPGEQIGTANAQWRSRSYKKVP